MAKLDWQKFFSRANSGRSTEIMFSVVAGAAADTNIAISGITRRDGLLSVIRLNKDATAANIDLDDLTSEVAITSDGNIQVDTTVTTGDKLLVIWAKRRS